MLYYFHFVIFKGKDNVETNHFNYLLSKYFDFDMTAFSDSKQFHQKFANSSIHN